MKKSLLIFPINSKASIEYARIARELGLDVIECTSVIDYEIKDRENLVHLPYISSPDFESAFLKVVAERNVGILYTLHSGVWSYFQRLTKENENLSGLRICNDAPLCGTDHQHHDAFAFGKTCREALLDLVDPMKVLGESLYAGLYNGYHQIPGQSNTEKLILFAQIAATAPAGDLIEIGSLHGRSAYALSVLARRHRIGSLVCVDPWLDAEIRDQGKQADLLNTITYAYDWDEIFRSFIVNTALLENFNYLRTTSEEANWIYRTGQPIQSKEFGETAVTGEVSIIHIDGNHSYESVKKDVDLWLPLVKNDGWIIIDDYEWAFGDGPKRIGDEVLRTQSVKSHTLQGGALAIQLRA